MALYQCQRQARALHERRRDVLTLHRQHLRLALQHGAALPADGLNGTQPQLNYHLDDFQNCIDLLRNEKPVYLLYNGSGGGFENALVTDPETVGEGEAGGLRFVGR